MTQLSVNINKVAVIRNARGGNIPDVVKFAIDCERFGADGITVHPRPDERHIKYDDVLALAKVVTTEFNIEGYPDERYMELIKKVNPAQATLVPDPPNVITSNTGWDVINNMQLLKNIIDEIQSMGIRVSVFLNPEIDQVYAAKESGTDRIELYTGPYAEHFYDNKEKAIEVYTAAGLIAKQIGLGLNAGHDLNLDNLKFFKQHLPLLDEVSIGHALISDALYFGIENTIQLYKRQLV
ncbi:MAG TPA: pyridoxine 5'-phosphate synthase [Chitinophagales bacterium]|nr:pyridoxine 5'-phosphate synthase [Chitinophagales bacterium]